MKFITPLGIQPARKSRPPKEFTPLELETRPTVLTDAAAFYLQLSEQTMRIYSCKETGPLRPLRISGRLHWKTQEIRNLLSGGSK